MNQSKAIYTRVFRDMEEAMFVISCHEGNIIYVNGKCEELLGFQSKLSDGKTPKYADLMSQDTDSRNDDFHQLILDSVYDSHRVHHRSVPYYRNGVKKIINLRTSFLRDEDGKEPIGIVAILEDVTEVEALQENKENSKKVFALFVGFLCLIIFLVQFLRDFVPTMRKSNITILIEILALVFMALLMRIAHIRFSDMGFQFTNIKRTLLTSTCVIIVLSGLLVGFKFLLAGLSPDFFPKDTPFFSIFPPKKYLKYLMTAFVQEFIARGVVQSSLNRTFDGKFGKAIALVVSAIAFGSIHFYYGFVFMVMASALVGVLGILFNKQKNIWGVTLIHFALGIVAISLGFI